MRLPFWSNFAWVTRYAFEFVAGPFVRPKYALRSAKPAGRTAIQRALVVDHLALRHDDACRVTSANDGRDTENVRVSISRIIEENCLAGFSERPGPDITYRRAARRQVIDDGVVIDCSLCLIDACRILIRRVVEIRRGLCERGSGSLKY